MCDRRATAAIGYAKADLLTDQALDRETSTAFGKNPAFVAVDERERLLCIFADLVAANGFEQVALADLAERAGVELGEVESYFQSRVDCALSAGDAVTEKCFSVVAEALMSNSGDDPLAAHAALEAMLRFMAGAPGFIQLVLVEFPRIGARGLARRRRYLDLFAEFLGPGIAAAPDLPPQPDIVGLLIGGGIWEVIAKHLHENRLDQLPQALPAVSFIAVAPFYGVEEARRVASLPASDG
jgi:AcrR family transcriptional regulator